MASRKETKPKKVTVKKTKKTSTKPVNGEIEEKDVEIDIVATKGISKKPLEIDAADILPETDEKIDEEAVALGIEDEDGDEIPSLDAEDLNPFGDKWEE